MICFFYFGIFQRLFVVLRWFIQLQKRDKIVSIQVNRCIYRFHLQNPRALLNHVDVIFSFPMLQISTLPSVFFNTLQCLSVLFQISILIRASQSPISFGYK